MRTVPGISRLFEPLEDALRTKLIPALARGRAINDLDRRLLELPPRMGGLGIPNPVVVAEEEFQNSLRLTTSLVEKIVAQEEQGEVNSQEIKIMKSDISKSKENKQKNDLQNLMGQLSQDT